MTLLPNITKWKESYWPVSLRNIDEKVLNKIRGNRTEWDTGRRVNCEEVLFIQDCKDNLILVNKLM